MSNMSYCRFQNTVSDLNDCAGHIRDKLSADETEARRSLVFTCLEILGEVAGVEMDDFTLRAHLDEIEKEAEEADAEEKAEQRQADIVDGYNRDDLGDSPDY